MNELQEKYGPEYATNNHPDKPECHLQFFGFPSNQFGYQEPAENFELMNTLKYVRPGYGFVPKFPLAGKADVNGKDELPIFTFLKGRCPTPMGLIANRTDITWTPIRNNDISWNFQKWLIASDGHPYRRYTSRTTPAMLEDDIKILLDKCVQGGSEPVTQHTAANVTITVQQPKVRRKKRHDRHGLFF
jgi:glutathione peroxidase